MSCNGGAERSCLGRESSTPRRSITGQILPGGGALDEDELKLRLEFYGIDYVFVGSLERQEYGENTAERLLASMPNRLETAFESGNTAVLRYVPIV